MIPPVPRTLLEKETDALPRDQLLAERSEFAVYYARSAQIPRLLEEIGRLRELTFREIGEGTGHAVDLDRFDSHYLHLFLWNREKKELVGAYRLGLSDRILEAHGVKGLYTHTLFRFGSDFLEKLGDCPMEIGRSFIRFEYQKKYNSLFLLWQGICAFIARNPRYKILFSPVSISQNYHMVSRNLIVQFLQEYKFDAELSRLVSPRRPYRVGRVINSVKGVDRKLLNSSVRDIDDVSVLISEIEKDGKGIPILIRH